MATSFLRFCRAGNINGMAFVSAAGTGFLGKGCAVGRVYTRSGEGVFASGLFVAWAMDFWGSSISSFPLPSSVSIGEVSSFFFIYIAPPLWCQSGTLLLGSLPLGEHAADW